MPEGCLERGPQAPQAPRLAHLGRAAVFPQEFRVGRNMAGGVHRFRLRRIALAGPGARVTRRHIPSIPWKRQELGLETKSQYLGLFSV